MQIKGYLSVSEKTLNMHFTVNDWNVCILTTILHNECNFLIELLMIMIIMEVVMTM